MPRPATNHHDTATYGHNLENNEDLSCENEALTWEDANQPDRLYTREEMVYALWRTLRIDEHQFLVLRYKLNVPEATCEQMALAMAMTKQGLHKIIARIRKEQHPLAFIFHVKKAKGTAKNL